MSNRASHGSLLVIFLTVLIDLLGFGIVLPLLPIYAAQFTMDQSGWQLGLLMASFSAMQFLFAPLWGRISDRVGRRPVILIGLLGSVIFYSLFGWATIRKSMTLLFASRIGAGMAGATISTAQAYIADSTSLDERPRGMALIGMAFGLGFTFGPLLGLLAVPSGQGDPGWMPGAAAAVLSAVALGLAWFLLPESLHADSEVAEQHVLDLRALRTAMAVPSVGALILAMFVCVFSFANFETTLSLLIKGETKPPVFSFTFPRVCLTFAYIGLVLSIVQGGLVRRMAGKVSEGIMATGGAVAEVVGFFCLAIAVERSSQTWLYLGLTVVVAGFAFITPSLNSLISRRSDPHRQGGILGLNQSVGALARIFGSGLGIPLLMINARMPLYVAAGLMALGGLLIAWSARRGSDFSTSTESSTTAALRGRR
jgi:MFS family permease